MNEAVQTADLVSRTRSGEGARPAAASGSGAVDVATTVSWLLLIVLGAGALAPIVRSAADELAEFSLVNADAPEIIRRLGEDLPATASTDYFEGLSELALMTEPAAPDVALAAARRATQQDAARPYAWTTIAYLESRSEGGATPEVFEAVSRSMDACAVCSQDLVRWRLNFVLTHWSTAPEALRRRAVEHADLLRWSGRNGEFLAEMRFKANQAGIPFDAYRSAVNTPVRLWDIGPAPDAVPE